MDLKSKIRVALGLEEEIKLQFQAKTEDGTTILLPAGTYKLDTGVTFRVEEEGIVAEVMKVKLRKRTNKK